MRISKFTIALIFLFTLGLFFVVRDLKNPSHDAPILNDLGDIDRIELQIDEERILAEKKKTEWTITSLNSESVVDDRANENRIQHILSIMKDLREIPTEKLDVKDLQKYGFDKPKLSIAVSWNTPTAGENAVLFGNTDLTQKFVYAFFPKKMLFTQTNSTILDLVKGKKASDFRNLSLSAVEGDSILEFKSSGAQCANNDWKSSQTGNDKEYDRNLEWIRKVSNLKFEKDLSANTSTIGYTEICKIKIIGIAKKDQFITILKKSNQILVKNNLLNAVYTPTKEMLDFLKIKN